MTHEPSDNQAQDEILRRQIEIAADVDALMRAGKTAEARKMLQESLDEIIPQHPPLRTSLIVSRPVTEQLRLMLKVIEDTGRRPRLMLTENEDQVLVTWNGERIGRLSARDVDALRRYGTDVFENYDVHALEIDLDEPVFAIELVRPTMAICTSCQKPHAGPQLNCEKCRSERRRKGAPEDAQELPSLGLDQAVNPLVRPKRKRL